MWILEGNWLVTDKVAQSRLHPTRNFVEGDPLDPAPHSVVVLGHRLAEAHEHRSLNLATPSVGLARGRFHSMTSVSNGRVDLPPPALSDPGRRRDPTDNVHCDHQSHDHEHIRPQIEEISIEHLIGHLFHIGDLGSGREDAPS